MALVEPPVPPDGEPWPARGVEGQVGGADRAGEHGGVEQAQVQGCLRRQQLSGPDRLRLSCRGEVDVGPAREEVAGVPLGLAVPEEDQVEHSDERTCAASRPKCPDFVVQLGYQGPIPAVHEVIGSGREAAAPIGC